MSVAILKNLLPFLRGGVIPLFLFLCCDIGYCAVTNSAVKDHTVATALERQLHKSHIWKSLLQMTNDSLNIEDPNFILSRDTFSLQNELVKTIESFFAMPDGSSNHAICRFPARFFWIKSELGMDEGIFPDVSCPEFAEYLKRAPAENIHLVFVSENVSQPSSMMGHVFLKLSGNDYKSNHVEHAVSFYTVIDTVNIPLLLVKSTVTGMDGFFSLLPYREQIKRYLEVEDRNVWEYELDLPDKNRTLMHYHIWELKGLRMKYLFTGYNCATVIYNILSLGSDTESENRKRLWITPKDVVKEACRDNLITGTKLIPSDKWNIRMLSEALDTESTDYIYRLFKTNDTEPTRLSNDTTKRLYQVELRRAYASYLYTQNVIDEKSLMTITDDVGKALEGRAPSDVKYYIDLSHYKSPLKTFDDSQLGVGYRMEQGQNYLRLHFLPTSNLLSDDNREYFNENSLKLGELSLLIDEESLRLESFQLYAMKSLIPWNKFVKGISGEFRLGLENHYDKALENHLAINVSGGLGLTKRISEDINTYLLINGGLGYGKSRVYLYAFPEIGATIYEVMNMKTTSSYKCIYNQLGSSDIYHALEITHAVFWDKQWKLSATFEHRFTNSYSDNAYELMFHVFF